jgi:hypothetical protein
VPNLTADQVDFSRQLAARTGYDLNVIEAFVASEGNANGTTGKYNFLNTTVTSGGVTVPGNPRHFSTYSSVSAAVNDTASFFSRLGLLSGSGQPPATQISTIANSPWGGASDATLTQIYNQIAGSSGVTLISSSSGSTPAAATVSSDCIWQAPSVLPSWVPLIGGSPGCILSRQSAESLKGVALIVAAGVIGIIGIAILVRSDPLASIRAIGKGSSGTPAQEPLTEEETAQRRQYDEEMMERRRSKVANREGLVRKAGIAGKAGGGAGEVGGGLEEVAAVA